MVKEGMLYHVAEWLLIIGGLNWMLAILNFNLVTAIFGAVPLLAGIVYGVVGASAIYLAGFKLKLW